MKEFYRSEDLTEKLKNRDFHKEYNECNKISDEKQQEVCLWKVLHDITKLQDHIQLSIPRYNYSLIHAKNLTNNANAILLGIADTCEDGCTAKQLLANDYIREKVEYLTNSYNYLVHDYNITVEDLKDIREKLRCVWEKDKDHISDEKTRKFMTSELNRTPEEERQQIKEWEKQNEQERIKK